MKAMMATLFTALALTGCQEKLEKIPTDSLPEEILEDVLEGYIEDKFNLPDDALDDKIDISFWDKE